MTIPLVSRVGRELETGADRIDRESLTPRLMHLGGGTPLALAESVAANALSPLALFAAANLLWSSLVKD